MDEIKKCDLNKENIGYSAKALDTPTIIEMSITYHQNQDSNSSCVNNQYLTIKTEYTPGNEGPYFKINIDNEDDNHWSIDDENDLIELIKDFKHKLNIK